MKMVVCRGAVVILLAALSVFPSACGGSGSGASGGGDPEAPLQQLLGEASLSAARNGYFEALFFFDNETKQEAVQWRAIGPYQRGGDGALRVDANYEHAGTLNGVGSATHGRLLILDNRAFLRHNGKAYRLPRSLAGQVPETTGSCQEALEEVDFGSLVKNLSSKPEPVSGGTVVEGDLNLGPLFEALHRLMSPSACGELVVGAGASPREMKALEAQIKGMFEKSQATFTIQKNHLLTGISLAAWIETPPPRREEIDGTLTVSLRQVNEIGAIRQPPLRKSNFAGAQAPAAEQLGRLEDWIALVDGVVGALAGP